MGMNYSSEDEINLNDQPGIRLSEVPQIALKEEGSVLRYATDD